MQEPYKPTNNIKPAKPLTTSPARKKKKKKKKQSTIKDQTHKANKQKQNNTTKKKTNIIRTWCTTAKKKHLRPPNLSRSPGFPRPWTGNLWNFSRFARGDGSESPARRTRAFRPGSRDEKRGPEQASLVIFYCSRRFFFLFRFCFWERSGKGFGCVFFDNMKCGCFGKIFSSLDGLGGGLLFFFFLGGGLSYCFWENNLPLWTGFGLVCFCFGVPWGFWWSVCSPGVLPSLTAFESIRSNIWMNESRKMKAHCHGWSPLICSCSLPAGYWGVAQFTIAKRPTCAILISWDFDFRHKSRRTQRHMSWLMTHYNAPEQGGAFREYPQMAQGEYQNQNHSKNQEIMIQFNSLI